MQALAKPRQASSGRRLLRPEVKITAHVFATNPASARVLKKRGFEQEGHLKKHYLKDGQYLDAWLYAGLR